MTKIKARSRSMGSAATGGVSTVFIIFAIVLFTFAGLLLTACDLLGKSNIDLPTPNDKIAYIRSVVGNDNALFAVDVDLDQVVGEPILVGRADNSPGNNMALAPNGKLYLLRSRRDVLLGWPNTNRGLLILDPNKGWQRTEPPLPEDEVAIAISRDGKAFIASWRRQKDGTTPLDVYDTSSDALIDSKRIVNLVDNMLAGENGLMYLNHGSNPELDPPQPAGIQVIRSSDQKTLADIAFRRYYAFRLALGPDGLIYAAVNRRLAPGEPELDLRARNENVGLLVAVDPNKAQVVAEMEVPVGPHDLAITPEGKAYILTSAVLQGGQPSKVIIYDLKQRKLLSELPVGRGWAFIKQVSPTKIYAATAGINEEKGRIWVIDTRSDTIIKSFEVGERPKVIVTTFSP